MNVDVADLQVVSMKIVPDQTHVAEISTGRNSRNLISLYSMYGIKHWNSCNNAILMGALQTPGNSFDAASWLSCFTDMASQQSCDRMSSVNEFSLRQPHMPGGMP